MNRRLNIISNVLSFLLTIGSLFVVMLVSNQNYSDTLINVICFVAIGAIVAGFINALMHELGHLFAGKKNGFKLHEISIWFFKWTVVGNKKIFSFTLPLNEAGYTEMIPTNVDCVEKGYKKMTLGGLYGSIFSIILGAVGLFFTNLPLAVFCIWSMFLPIGMYYLAGNLLPMISGGARNDGAVLFGIKKKDDVTKVTINLLKYQAELYNGKTPGEVDEKLLFDLPQLPEDDLTFIMLLNARYYHYLDKSDFENAKKVCNRLATLFDYMPKQIKYVVQTDLLYNYCTFDYNDYAVDDVMYEIEKYLNKVNNAQTMRAKTAYLLYVEKQAENIQMFFDKTEREIEKCPLKGIGLFEKKLLEIMKKDA